MLEKIKNRAIRLAMQAYMATRRHSVTDGVVGIQLRRPKKAPHYSSEVLRAGSVQSKGASPLPVDIQVERDVPVRLRDGTTIYTDVFRPTGADRVPAVVAWSPYGKTEPFDSVAKPEQALSGLQKFEAADSRSRYGRGGRRDRPGRLQQAGVPGDFCIYSYNGIINWTKH